MAGSALSVLDLITEALALYGEYAAGEAIDAATVQSLLFTLNAAIDGLGGEPLAIFQTSILSFSTVAGQQTYTLGPDPANNWITTAAAPAAVLRAGLVLNGLELPIAILTADEWAALELKGLQSSITSGLWPQYGATSHTLSLWPVPSAAAPVRLYGAQQTAQFTAASDSVSLPPGYQEFLVYDLALKSASKFGAELPSWLPVAWREAKTRIKERNFAALDCATDPALTHRSGRGWPSINFYTGK